MRAARLGFAEAEIGDLFFPDRNVTRSEIVMFAYNSLLAYGAPLPPHGAGALRPFPDAPDVPYGMAEQFHAVFGESIMIGIGMPGGGRIIGPGYESTWEQAALVIYRYILWLHANG
jgi:hypothetical protein